ncbi:MAG: NAD(P)/FAD-dependent oxidoreductase [Nitrospirae bacterium]|nr:NAD(P)/FAD-dependent oxidoreductase [Nitrospirota bacterium]
MIKKRIIILGGGIGGQAAANRLRGLLDGQHEITIIDRNESFAFPPSFLWLMTGDRRPEEITRKTNQLVRPGIEVIQAEVRRIDLAGHFVEIEGRRLDYDYLIIALGADLAPEIIPGMAEAAHTFYTIEGAKRLHDTLKGFRDGTLAIVVGALPYKCPGAPHEASMLFADFFRKSGLRDKVDIHLFTPEPQPLPVAGPKLGGEVRQMLEAKGIHLHPLHKLMSVNPQARELIFEGKEKVGYDLLAAIPPHRGPNIIREAGLANEAGWIPVDRATLATRNENVYAIGDVAAVPIPGRWKPDAPLMLPKAGVFAHTQAEVVAHNIAAEIMGSAANAKFQGMGYCMLEAGDGRAGLAFGNFFAEPSPEIQLKGTGKTWHLGKVLFEQWWLAPFGPRREALRLAFELGARLFGIPVEL